MIRPRRRVRQLDGAGSRLTRVASILSGTQAPHRTSDKTIQFLGNINYSGGREDWSA